MFVFFRFLSFFDVFTFFFFRFLSFFGIIAFFFFLFLFSFSIHDFTRKGCYFTVCKAIALNASYGVDV
ncbi:hypothetical protein A3SI_16410 [Nitritalea halalkaliphila LW7]|uniref:Uncharacterized protein n=1 Tax=Nitritalea halalkaliphila LW7 TaxID=1189621 RepID=I5BWZ5_9BACT|nr:hypothetical protein A3SI_16410 [Nitritalea halalkaliphila LW7]